MFVPFDFHSDTILVTFVSLVQYNKFNFGFTTFVSQLQNSKYRLLFVGTIVPFLFTIIIHDCTAHSIIQSVFISHCISI